MHDKRIAPTAQLPNFRPSWGPVKAFFWFITIIVVSSVTAFAAEHAGFVNMSLPDGTVDTDAFLLIAAPLQIIGSLLVASRLRFNPLDVLALRFPVRVRQLIVIALALTGVAVVLTVVVIVIQEVFESNGGAVATNKGQEVFTQSVLRSGLLPSLMISGFLVPVAEESMFRGLLLLSYYNTRLWFWGAAIITSLLFAFFHNPATLNPFVHTTYFVTALAFALALRWTGSLWVPIGMHALKNAIAVFALSFHWFD